MSKNYRNRVLKKRAKTTKKYIEEFKDFIINELGYSDFRCNFRIFYSPNKNEKGNSIYGLGGITTIRGQHTSYVGIYLREIEYNCDGKFYEYDEYDKDKEIGGFYCSHYNTIIRATLAHELSHALLSFKAKRSAEVLTSSLSSQAHLINISENERKPHGKEFQDIYRILRNKLVNPYIPDQKKCKNSYFYNIKQAILTEYGFN